MNSKRVLVVDDEPHILKTLGVVFESMGFQATLCSRPRDAFEAAGAECHELAFIDLMMTPIDGMELLAFLKRFHPGITVVMMTARGSIDSAVEAMKNGAFHFIRKPFELDALRLIVNEAWEYHRLNEEANDLRARCMIPGEAFVTRDRGMLEQLAAAAQCADSDLNVLLEGESGTGKEMLARFIHSRSSRSEKQLVKVNCAALPADLLESELFGCARGAYTGAVRDRAGRFETADGGTLFLDEIGEIPPTTQVKLLRVLQTKEFERLGEDVSRSADVRIIAATNRNLDAAMAEQSFRDDLFFRLNGIRFRLIPLRERPGDLPVLVEHFLIKFSPERRLTLDAEVEHALMAYSWPGNVRELEHVIERAVVLAAGTVITCADLPPELVSAGNTQHSVLSLEEMQRRHIKHILDISRDYEQAAHILQIDTATLWRKRKKFGL